MHTYPEEITKPFKKAYELEQARLKNKLNHLLDTHNELAILTVLGILIQERREKLS